MPATMVRKTIAGLPGTPRLRAHPAGLESQLLAALSGVEAVGADPDDVGEDPQVHFALS
jgi:hypothetical protein